jgi:hypothetical protein
VVAERADLFGQLAPIVHQPDAHHQQRLTHVDARAAIDEPSACDTSLSTRRTVTLARGLPES